jgi:hypothetical protein
MYKHCAVLHNEEVTIFRCLIMCYIISINHGFMKNVQILGQRNEAKMLWIQDPNQSNLDNLNNATPKASRNFRNTNMGYINAKINELQTVRISENCMSDHKMGYQSTTNIVKDEKGDLVADPHSILAK